MKDDAAWRIERREMKRGDTELKIIVDTLANNTDPLQCGQLIKKMTTVKFWKNAHPKYIAITTGGANFRVRCKNLLKSGCTANQNCGDIKKKCEMGERLGQVQKGQTSDHMNPLIDHSHLFC